jgi:hypothetical protein
LAKPKKNPIIEEYRRLSGEPFSWLNELDGMPSVPVSYVGGQADLTPLRNKAREAMDALNDAQKAADVGRADDAYEAVRRAKAAIDIILGGSIGPYPSGTGGPPTSYGGGGPK